MSDRYARRPSDGEQVCRICGSLVSEQAMHDLYHDRIDRLTDMRVNRRGVAMVGGLILNDPPLTSITATDWQAAHDAGEDEEMFYGAAHTCALCGHHARFLGGSVTEPGRVTVHLCHGCDEDHDCYRRWTVYGQRPHANGCRDLYCGGCEEVDPSHADPCDCDDCRTQPTLQREADTPTNEPPVGSVARCTGCGNVYVHKADGWVSTDDGSRQLAWAGLQRPSCGPLRVIYTPEEDK